MKALVVWSAVAPILVSMVLIVIGVVGRVVTHRDAEGADGMKTLTGDSLILAGLVILFAGVIIATIETYFSMKEPAPVQSWHEYDRCLGRATRLGQPMTPCADLMPPKAQED